MTTQMVRVALTGWVLLAAFPAMGAGSLRFDFGPEESAASGALVVTAASTYSADTAWGWTSSAKRRDFDRTELVKSRSALTRDSVSADTLRFKADVDDGEWHVVFWAESGLRDEAILEFRINGEPQALAWRDFDSPAEPRERMRDEFRLFIGKAAAGGDGLEFAWAAAAEPVHVIGLWLIPATGSNDTDIPPEVARFHAETLAYAEHYYEGLRGWESSRHKTGLSMFGRYAQAIALLDGLLGDPAFAASPMFDRALYNRARLQYWLGKEQRGPRTIAAARRDLAALAGRGLDTDILRMYNGERVDTPDVCDRLESVQSAPTWAVQQRETLCRMRLVAYWWIDIRQADNGELGGKLADDVEITRWWAAPVLAGDRRIADGWLKLAGAVWASDLMEDGYVRAPIDVEHSSEPVSDTALILALYGGEYASERLLPSVRHFRGHWTRMADDGRRYFRSAWIGANDVDERPPRDRDVPMNARAVKAVRYAAFLDPNPEVVTPLLQWSLFWVDAAMRSDKGKPEGIVPASVRGLDGALNGDEDNWYRANMFWHYYDWQSGVGREVYDQLLFTYRLTGHADLLRPITTTLRLIEEHHDCAARQTGNACWAAQTLLEHRGFLASAEQWRLETGSTEFDELLMARSGDYLRYRISGDPSTLDHVADDVLGHMRYNFPMLTSEALFTDRVYATGKNSASGLRDLFGMLTGSVSTDSPFFDFTWEDTPGGFTALVDSSSRVNVFLFGEGAETVTIRAWGLPQGRYRLKVSENGTLLRELDVTVSKPGARIRLGLPARKLLALEFAPQAPSF